MLPYFQEKGLDVIQIKPSSGEKQKGYETNKGRERESCNKIQRSCEGQLLCLHKLDMNESHKRLHNVRTTEIT